VLVFIISIRQLKKTMRAVRSKRSIVSVLTFALLLSFSGSGHGLVLCWGHDGHMHIEVTFNGIECGHLPLSPVQTNSRHYLTAASPSPTAPCYACTDIPIAFPRHLLKQNSYSTSSHNGKTAITTAAPPSASHPLIPQSLHPDGRLKIPIKSHATLNQILSSFLRI
jgi:hypothetical protein